MTLTIGSYLSGMGMLDAGALEAGFAPVFGVEFDPGNPAVSLAIADMHERNIPGEYLLRRDVCDVDPAGLDYVDWFHASPVCKEFSQAKKDGKETTADVAVANAIVRYILHHRPRFVTLENVWQYRLSQSWNAIYQAIKRLYGIRVMKINCADYGVAQTRVRMIVLAHLGGPGPPKMRPTHTERPPEQASLFDVSLPRWAGWYEAIADLIPALPDSEFAPWQLARLPDELKTALLSQGISRNHKNEDYGIALERQPDEAAFTITSNSNMLGMRAVLVGGANTSDAQATAGVGISSIAEPTRAVNASNAVNWRAFVVDGANTGSNGGQAKIRGKEQPVFAVTAASGDKVPVRAGLDGRIVKMTPRALARFQSLPDWYELSGNNTVDCTAIGNGIPSLFARRLGEHIRRLAR